MHPECSVPYEYTADIASTEKWSVPKRTSPTIVLEDCSDLIPTHNRFAPLLSQSSPEPPAAVTEPSVSDSTSTSNQQQSKSGNVVNLSRRVLSDSELSLLDLGLSFSPSCKSIDKLKLCEDTHNFIRRIQITEFFKDSDSREVASESDRDSLNWTLGNPDWYPAHLQHNCSDSVKRFIERTVEDIRQEVMDNDTKFWNNLSADQRKALTNLKADKTIVIKPSDKSGGIVVMDRTLYEGKCLEHLTNGSFYEEVPEDPNPVYRHVLDSTLDSLKDDRLISEMEFDTMKKGIRSPCFYALPKIHKSFENFPEIRPICSGSDGVTVKLSEFVDSFLGYAARKTSSYVKDTTDFVNKIRNVKLPSDSNQVFVATMDVSSLYTNIDHSEGIAACKRYLDQRSNKRFPTSKLCSLVQFILKSNTMQFLGKFYHQIKGTAMGTPMAVNYANLFMASFETDLLNDFVSEHGSKPFLWLRYIDDVFFVWVGSEESLHVFVNFVKQYASNKGMKSDIQFTSMHSNKSVQFLDTVVKIEGDSLVTDLFSKPTASHDYLHRSSYHPQHLLNALPKSQFIRIRRICSHLKDFKRHAKMFVEFFKKRGYRESELHKLVASVEGQSQESFLAPKPQQQSTGRVPYVVDYHHKLHGIPHILKRNHLAMIRNDPSMKAIFPSPPIVSYRKQRNLRDHLVRADHRKPTMTSTVQPKTNRTCIQDCMNHSGKVTNDKANITLNVRGGNSNDKNVIYAAKCLKCRLLYVGYTTTPLNVRFNNNRSHIRKNLDTCELVQHFANNSCDFQQDLELTVLQHVSGSRQRLELEEDKWIARLDTKHPNGLNERLSSYGKLYYDLFR